MENITRGVGEYLDYTYYVDEEEHDYYNFSEAQETAYIGDLHADYLVMKSLTNRFEKCLDGYKDFLHTISVFLKTSSFYNEKKPPALPEFTLQIERAQIDLRNSQANLQNLRDEIAHNNKTKLEIAAEVRYCGFNVAFKLAKTSLYSH